MKKSQEFELIWNKQTKITKSVENIYLIREFQNFTVNNIHFSEYNIEKYR